MKKIPAAVAIVSAVIMSFLAGPAVCQVESAAERNPSMQGSDPEDFAVPREWLHSRVTLSEIEGPGRAADLIRPADSAAWRAFKSQFVPQDVLWYFSSPAESFGRGAGRMGYVIMRDGKQAASFIALMN